MQVGDNAGPTKASLHNDLGLIIFEDPVGGPVAALEHFVRATEIHPNFPNAQFNAAVSSAKAGDHDGAIPWCMLHSKRNTTQSSLLHSGTSGLWN